MASEIITEPNVSRIIGEFIGKTSNIFTNTVCKNWDNGFRKTSKRAMYESSFRISESYICGFTSNNELFKDAVKTSNPSIVSVLYKGFPKTYDCVNIAIENGKIENLKWLINMGFPIDNLAMVRAGLNKKWEILRYLYSICKKWTNDLTMMICQADEMETLVWMKKKKIDIDNRCLKFAILNKNWKMAKWLHINGLRWTRKDSENSCMFCDVKFLQWMESMDLPFSEGCMVNAAISKNWDNVKWLIRGGVSIDNVVTELVSACGNLIMIDFLKRNNIKFSSNCQNLSAKNGHWVSVKMLISHIGKVDSRVLRFATSENKHHIIEWILSRM